MSYIPITYVPKNLTKKQKKQVIKDLKKSRKAYKKGKYHGRKKIKGLKTKKSKWISIFQNMM